MLTPEDFPTTWQAIEYFAARHIWTRRNELTPKGGIPWHQWFKARFKRSLDEARADFLARMEGP